MSIFDYDLEAIVREGKHELWQINQAVNFAALLYRLKDLETELGRQGYGLEVGLKAMYLQFHYDLSDRKLEDDLRFNVALRWFCGFSLDEKTPDHTFFCRFRRLMGTKRIGKIFKSIVDKAQDKKLVRQVFTFVDATAIKVKETTWAERDKALSEGEDKLNNDNVGGYGADSQARFGCKGKNKFWYGYKESDSVDMSSGLITKVAVNPANVSDTQAFQHVCPKGGMVFADKAYCLKLAQDEMRKNGCHSGAIQKNNMKTKNRDLDRWLSGVRAQFEGVFSQRPKRARYRGIAKVQLQAFMQAIVFNCKRLVTINAPPLFAGA